MDTKKASYLKELVDTIKIIDEYSMFSRILIRKDWRKHVIWDLKMTNLMHLYNKVHI